MQGLLHACCAPGLVVATSDHLPRNLTLPTLSATRTALFATRFTVPLNNPHLHMPCSARIHYTTVSFDASTRVHDMARLLAVNTFQAGAPVRAGIAAASPLRVRLRSHVLLTPHGLLEVSAMIEACSSMLPASATA
jgi:hypothetical protein